MHDKFAEYFVRRRWVLLCRDSDPYLQKFFIVVNLVKQHSIEDLVAKLKAGQKIQKERVIKESKLSFNFPALHISIECNISGQQSPGQRRSNDRNHHVFKVSIVNFENRCALSVDSLHS